MLSDTEPILVEPELAPDTEHLATLPNAMSLTRPVVLGPLAAKMLLSGERGVTSVVLAMAATDAEGKVARAIDQQSIEQTGEKNGYGTTEFGKSIDPIADTLGFLEIAGAALKSPRVSKMGKLAVGIVLAQESVKSGWAVRAGVKYKRATGEKLVLDVTPTGKQATAEKFAALTGAVLTHDLKPGRARNLAGIAAVGAAIRGAYHGEKARKQYKDELASQEI